jgi:hypothetical protein
MDDFSLKREDCSGYFESLQSFFLILEISGDAFNVVSNLFKSGQSTPVHLLFENVDSTNKKIPNCNDTYEELMNVKTGSQLSETVTKYPFNILFNQNKKTCFVAIKCSSDYTQSLGILTSENDRIVASYYNDNEEIKRNLDISVNEFEQLLLSFSARRYVSSLTDFLDIINYFKILSIKDAYEKCYKKWDGYIKKAETNETNSSELRKSIITMLKNQSNLLRDELNIIMQFIEQKSTSASTRQYHAFKKIMFGRAQIINENASVACMAGLPTEDLTWTVDDKNDGLLFRGITETLYQEKPSLFRDEHLAINEDSMYHSFFSSFSNEFENKTRFDILSTMRHHGLPTRLLDVTSNPLAALYMACTNQFSIRNSDSFGEVIVYFPNQFSNEKNLLLPEDPRVAAISSLPLLTSQEKSFLRVFLLLCKNGNISPKTLYQKLTEDRAYINDYEKFACEAFKKLTRIAFPTCFDVDFYTFDPYSLLNAYYVVPNQINERIKAQSGSFILFGLQGVGAEKEFVSSRTPGEYQMRIIIENKEQLIQELSDINVNRSTLFPDMDNVAAFLKEQQK